MKRDFLQLKDLSVQDIQNIIKRAIDFKSRIDKNKCPLISKSIGLFFEKPSTRTKISFEVAIYQLGGQSVRLNPKEMQLGRGETIQDTAKVISRYLNGIVLRTYSHSFMEEFASYCSIPVINGLSDIHHPCQALADIMTIFQKKGNLKDICLVYIGDGNNVANSLIQSAQLMGMDIIVSCPEGYEPNSTIVKDYKFKIIRDPFEAVKKADIIYTDVWVSMGQEQYERDKKNRFKEYQVNNKLIKNAKRDALIFHCLPAHRGEEITDEVIDSPNSAIFEQAENRLHTEKALLEFLIE